MPNPVGPLIPADENLTHQVVDTFASVGTSDPSWTEKVCAMAMANDGSLQIGFGLGKYTNRNVMDAYAAVSRGVEQSPGIKDPSRMRAFCRSVNQVDATHRGEP